MTEKDVQGERSLGKVMFMSEEGNDSLGLVASIQIKMEGEY